MDATTSDHNPRGESSATGSRVEVIDTTGAGDGFVAGLWSALLPSLPTAVADLDRDTVEAACALANRVAARVVTRLGATAALPRRSEL